MKRILITTYFLIFGGILSAQNNKTLIRYCDAVSGLCGYKNAKGSIIIPAQYRDILIADSLLNIIAVTDTLAKSYYLLKNNTVVGGDSVYIFDFAYDCESEESILFRDRKTDRVGFFDQNGKVIIPAIYNSAKPFHNGLTLALKNGKRKCWDDACEHWGWDSTTKVLINKKNEEIIADWKDDSDEINWYSMTENKPATDTDTYVTLNGTNGHRYSFACYNKEFRKWFYSEFLPVCKQKDCNKLKPFIFSTVSFEIPGIKSSLINKKIFIEKYFNFLKNKLLTAVPHSFEFHRGEQPPTLLKSNSTPIYFDACRNFKRDKYPIFEVEFLTSYLTNRKKIQNQYRYQFLRTNVGYQLVEITLL